MRDDLFATVSIYSAPHKTITKMEYCIKESSHCKREGSRYNFWRFPVSDERFFAALRMTGLRTKEGGVILGSICEILRCAQNDSSQACHSERSEESLARSCPAVLTPVILGTYIVYMLNEFSSFM